MPPWPRGRALFPEFLQMHVGQPTRFTRGTLPFSDWYTEDNAWAASPFPISTTGTTLASFWQI